MVCDSALRLDLVRAKAFFCQEAITHRIAERIHVPARLPNLRMHDDGGVEAHDVLALAGHGVPPQFLHVALQLGTERAVIPKAVDAAVDFGGLKNESAAFAQRHDLLHAVVRFRFSHRTGSV
jgi:hypothetical protein